MRTTLLVIAMVSVLFACSNGQQKSVKQDDSVLQEVDTVDTQDTVDIQDTVDTQESLNDIRFENWEDRDWLDNEYVATLRKYLDDYNSGKVRNTDLDPYKERIKGKFVVANVEPSFYGGLNVRIIFFDMPDRIFTSWIYSSVNEEKGIVENYEFRSIHIEEETTGLTQDDILQVVKEVDGVKFW